MFQNYFRVAIRNLLKSRFFTLLNIIGLSVGIVSCLLIFHYIHYETSFDKFHDDYEQIYRLRYERTADEGTIVQFASCCPPGAPFVKEKFPQIEKIGRLYRHKAVMSFEQKKFTEEFMFFAEPELLDVFTFSLVDGTFDSALVKPGTALIASSVAKKYFGDEPATGKMFQVDKDNSYIITGVYKDFPENSHIQCDVLLAYKDLITLKGQELQEAWGYTGFFTYLRLTKGTDVQELQSQILNSVENEFKEWIEKYGVHVYLQLQPLADIHLKSHYLQEFKVNGSQDTVRILSVIAVFIVLMAWINYINLSTAMAMSRAKEVGIRKVVGASRRHLGTQFLLETVIVNALSVLIALVLIVLVLPQFYHFTGMPDMYSLLDRVWFWAGIAILFVAGVVFSGSYPVFLLTSFKPQKVLKVKNSAGFRGMGLRKVLLLTQFIIALLLITGTFAIYNQIRFMRKQDLGFAMNQTLVFKVPRVVAEEGKEEKFEAFKTEAKRLSGVTDACFVTEVPGRQFFWDNGGIRKKGSDQTHNRNYMITGVDFNFIEMFDLEIVAGRSFSREFSSDKGALMLNEKAVEWMGFESAEEAVGSEVSYWEKIYPIIGVVKNYHQQTVKDDFEPQIFRYYPTAYFGVFALNLDGKSIPQSMKQVQELWAQFFPGNPFDFYFLDEYYDQQYKADQMFGQVIGLFSVLAVLVTCLGILGLSAYSAVQRTKEVGIRKVLGANVPGIVLMFAKDFLLLLGIAFIVALPAGIYGIRLWLNDFVQKMDLNVLLFLLPLIVVWIITLLTVTTQAFRAAQTNPVDTLRYE